MVGYQSNRLGTGDLIYLFRDDGSDCPIFTKNYYFKDEAGYNVFKNADIEWGCCFLEQIVAIDQVIGLDFLLMLYPEHTKVITMFFNDLSIESIDNGIDKV